MIVKKILVYIFAIVLSVNAGMDLASWMRTKAADRAAAADARAALPGVVVHKVECVHVNSIGWACELDLTLSSGQNGKVVKIYSDDEIKATLSK